VFTYLPTVRGEWVLQLLDAIFSYFSHMEIPEKSKNRTNLWHQLLRVLTPCYFASVSHVV
jgi:hypothetical protein